MSPSDPTPLAQRLREVAHKADVQAHNRAILAVIGKRMSQEDKAVVVSWARSSAVTVAVLRELAQLPDRPNRYALADAADTIGNGAE